MIRKLSWFLDRLHKDIYRKKDDGIMVITIRNKKHAQYLFRLQAMENHRYFDDGEK